MVIKRYGVFIPPFGYVYSGAAWEKFLFTPDATKAALGRSFGKVAAALEFIDAIKRQKSEEFKTVQLAVYTVQATAEIQQAVDAKEKLQGTRTEQYADKVSEFKELKAKYDGMPASELDRVSDKAWNYYKGIERKLLLLELI